jgi:hypothetical protein
MNSPPMCGESHSLQLKALEVVINTCCVYYNQVFSARAQRIYIRHLLAGAAGGSIQQS